MVETAKLDDCASRVNRDKVPKDASVLGASTDGTELRRKFSRNTSKAVGEAASGVAEELSANSATAEGVKSANGVSSAVFWIAPGKPRNTGLSVESGLSLS